MEKFSQISRAVFPSVCLTIDIKVTNKLKLWMGSFSEWPGSMSLTRCQLSISFAENFTPKVEAKIIDPC